jgi:hypothetical protein
MDHSLSTFLSGCAPYHDLIFFAKSLDELDEVDQGNSTFLFIDGPKTARLGEPMAWPAISMVTVKPAGGERLLCAIGPNGELWECAPGNDSYAAGDMTLGSNSWRSLAVVDGEIYACGMDRVVAVRMGPLAWRDISAPPAGNRDGIIGFEGIDGFSRADLYAVGWQGEIWQRKANRWRQIDSPVSSNLNAVCCAEDGVAYVVGDGGVMLRGRDDQWNEIATGVTDNLQDVRDFGGTVYVATDFAILQFAGNGLDAVTNFADVDDEPNTCLHLLKAADGLVSLGQKDVFRLFGDKWERVV